MVKVSRAWCKELAAKMKTMRVFFTSNQSYFENAIQKILMFVFLQYFAQIKQFKNFSLFN